MKKRAQQILIRHKVRRAQLARDLGITASALWQWQTVPAERVIQVEKFTGIPRHELRPDLYPVEESVA
jgi:DNA-binding transcriptional regulator YdaS (Cro superfamily)